MMAPSVRACPSRTLPSVQTHELGALVDRDHAVDLAIRMRMVLPLEVVLAVQRAHIYSRHRAIPRGFRRTRYSAPAVPRPGDVDVGNPAFFQAELD